MYIEDRVFVFSYTTQEEADQIIQAQTAKGLLLVEVANVTEGNFLRFTENILKPLETELAGVKAEKELLSQQVAQTNADLVGFIDQYYIDNPDKA